MNKVAIFGVPRSGTTWLSQIFNSHPDVVMRFQPLFSYGHKGNLTTCSSATEIRNFFEEILCTQDSFTLMDTDIHKKHPTFKKSMKPTHIAFKETRYLNVIENILTQCDEVKFIGIVRNPLAVMASWALAPKEFNPKWDINSEWRYAPGKNQNRAEEFYGFEKWKEVAIAFQEFNVLFPQQFLLLSYDELNREPLEVTRKLFDFCGLEIREQVKQFIVDSKSRHDSDPYSIYRAKANDNRWREILPVSIAEKITQELKNTSLDIFLHD